MKKILLAILLLLAFVSCKETEYVERVGTVTKKVYIPARTTTTMRPVYIGKIMYMQPMTHHYPAQYHITVEYTVTQTRVLTVPRVEYEEAVLGSKKVFKEIKR